MLTENELGPFIIIVPLIGLCICLVGVFNTRQCPLLASTIAIWHLLVIMTALTNPFYEANSLEWSEKKIDDAAGVSLIIAGMMIPLVGLYLLFTKSPSVRSFVLQEVNNISLSPIPYLPDWWNVVSISVLHWSVPKLCCTSWGNMRCSHCYDGYSTVSVHQNS